MNRKGKAPLSDSTLRRGRSPGSNAPASVLAAGGIRPSKSRGQNFLTQRAVAAKIATMARLGSGDRVIEIGPGLGILTEQLLEARPQRLWLVELDRDLAQRMRRALADRAAVEIIEADFLKLDLEPTIERPGVVIVGNLPFNVATAILRKLATVRHLVSRMVLMFQREVAERIRAQPGTKAYGALSVLCAMDWEVGERMRVAAGSFFPQPTVDAEVLVFTPRAVPYPPAKRQAVARVVRAAFASRRKTMRNTLGSALGIDPTSIEAALAAAGIDPAIRAERLALEDFARLAEVLPISTTAAEAADA